MISEKGEPFYRVFVSFLIASRVHREATTPGVLDVYRGVTELLPSLIRCHQDVH